ncbi:Hypothetical protein Bdt_1001 [Bdellovibrio bacteriovorus str. Tiberius]|uniref:Uncharacterized protein n=1 Tax=Bdellovibrio bacteriovorus str. Tiberius TaxID=1069642 RepID=K7YLP6_BDEBC|nr:Hypothetical protein Bdt_1001 [Bdellovibrio bacteriovorus str. Tiberius]
MGLRNRLSRFVGHQIQNFGRNLHFRILFLERILCYTCPTKT